jgi:hypothetical protein
MENNNKCCCHNSEVGLQRLWAEAKATFAEKQDLLTIIKELQRISNKASIQAIQSGEDGPIQPVGSDQIAHVEYENWVESEGLDAAGKPVHVYNDSKNALTAAAAAMVIKQIRHDVSRLKNFEIVVCELGDDGYPSVPSVDFNTLYITPSGDEENGYTWTEWIYVKKNPNDKEINPHFERVGADVKGVDMTTVKNEVAKLRTDLRDMTNALADALLNKAVKPLKDLQAYVKSQDFANYIANLLPQVNGQAVGVITDEEIDTLIKNSGL